jgi:glycosyltransferase involved in cell wall biosynthesis
VSRLSVVIPAYNEERFIGALLGKVAAVDLRELDLEKEVVVVDDCSTDRTSAIAGAVPGVVLRRLARNSGKGAAVRAGIAASSGELLIIQDADLEYEPGDYRPMLEALLADRLDAVYGSRYLRRGRYPGQSLPAYAGGRLLSVVAWAATGRYLTDTVTALKLFRGEVIRALPLVSSGFELDHEITCRLLARGHTLAEVPIRYQPRSRGEGKKIGARDFVKAVRTFWRFRRG